MSRQTKLRKKPTRTSFLTPQPGMNFLLMDDGDTVLICGAGAILVDANGDGCATLDELECIADHFLARLGRA